MSIASCSATCMAWLVKAEQPGAYGVRLELRHGGCAELGPCGATPKCNKAAVMVGRHYR